MNVYVFLCPGWLHRGRCDNIEKLKAQLPKMEQELKDHGKFKDFYQFTFNFAKNPGQKGLGKNRPVCLHEGLAGASVVFLFCFRFRNGYSILEFSAGWEI